MSVGRHLRALWRAEGCMVLAFAPRALLVVCERDGLREAGEADSRRRAAVSTGTSGNRALNRELGPENIQMKVLIAP